LLFFFGPLSYIIGWIAATPGTKPALLIPVTTQRSWQSYELIL